MMLSWWFVFVTLPWMLRPARLDSAPALGSGANVNSSVAAPQCPRDETAPLAREMR